MAKPHVQEVAADLADGEGHPVHLRMRQSDAIRRSTKGSEGIRSSQKQLRTRRQARARRPHAYAYTRVRECERV